MKLTGMSRSTVVVYLCDYIRTEKPASLQPWIDASKIERIIAAARQHGTERLKPIFVALEEKVEYDEIRIVVAGMKAKRDAV
jgi:ATP-dependent DNA helicase RecQ